jgi:hypothetical protein
MSSEEAFDRECAALVDRVCDASRPASERDRDWQQLLVRLAPPLEEWIRKNRLLRRAGLATPDDTRAVLVAVFARLARDDFDNLRRWLARRPTSDGDDALETDAVERIVGIAREPAEAEEPAVDAVDAARTPFRGWLLNLVQFVVKDHVKQRLGWTRGELDKRDLGTNANRLDDVGERGDRPPVTDLVALRRLLADIRAYTETFPEPMKAALDLWTQDFSFDEIASRLGLATADEGRALARAAQARLRERFRGAWPGGLPALG